MAIVRQDLAEIHSLHPDHKIDPAIVRQVKKISDSNISAIAKVEAIEELVGNIGADSGLLLDPEAESIVPHSHAVPRDSGNCAGLS